MDDSFFDEHLQIEEDFYASKRKESKLQRKVAEKTDRSKYRKSDIDKEKKAVKEDFSHLPVGRVIAIYPQGIWVDYAGQKRVCTLKGALKKEASRLKNLVTVGDFVRFEKIGDDEGIIASVDPRKSLLSRADHMHKRKEQLIAANIDQVLITLSIFKPILKPFLADRYLVAAVKGNLNPVIVVNKVDLLESPPEHIPKEDIENEILIFEEFRTAYSKLGFPYIEVSTKTGQGVQDLLSIMQNKASVFSGQSGVGKSSLINATTGTSLRTQEVVDRNLKGMHTTTTTELIPLKEGSGWCIDTPGLRSFGLWNVEKEEIEPCFREIHEMRQNCRFRGCRHLEEPDCAVKAAVEKEQISWLRYESYRKMLEEDPNDYGYD